MSKFYDKPLVLRTSIEYITDDIDYRNSLDLEVKLKEWKDQYPDRTIVLEFDSGSSGCDCCSSSPHIEIIATREETLEEMEIRRQQWEKCEKKQRAEAYQRKKKRTKEREEEEKKEYQRLQRKYGAKVT